jgi:hypothetical protein
VSDEITLDELLLAAGGEAEGGGGEAVEITERAEGGLVEHGDRVGGHDLAIAAGKMEAMPDVLGGVVGDKRVDAEPRVEPRVEERLCLRSSRAWSSGSPTSTRDNSARQRPAIPFVVHEDMEMVEGVLVKEVRLVEEEDGVEAIAAELLDVLADGVKPILIA